MIRIGSFKVYLNTDIYGWRMTGIGWGATWFFGFSITKPDECREAFDKKYLDIWNQIHQRGK